MHGATVLLAPSEALQLSRSVCCPMESFAGAVVEESCASSIVPIVEGSAVGDPVDEPKGEPVDESLGFIDELVYSVSKGCGPSDAVLPLISESVVIVREVDELAVQTDSWFTNFCEDRSK